MHRRRMLPRAWCRSVRGRGGLCAGRRPRHGPHERRVHTRVVHWLRAKEPRWRQRHAIWAVHRLAERSFLAGAWWPGPSGVRLHVLLRSGLSLRLPPEELASHAIDDERIMELVSCLLSILQQRSTLSNMAHKAQAAGHMATRRQ